MYSVFMHNKGNSHSTTHNKQYNNLLIQSILYIILHF